MLLFSRLRISVPFLMKPSSPWSVSLSRNCRNSILSFQVTVSTEVFVHLRKECRRQEQSTQGNSKDAGYTLHSFDDSYRLQTDRFAFKEGAEKRPTKFARD